MNPESKVFLKQLVETPSPSGYEHDVQKLVRERIQPWCESVRTDVMGNVFGTRHPEGKPRIMLAGHCDQIGFIVNTSPTKDFSMSSRSAASIQWWRLRNASRS